MRFFTLLLLLVYSSLSLALGLGEAELKSHLGEKLLAKVNVTDFEVQTESSCFTATDISDAPAFKKANVTLKPSNSGHQLTITTNDVVTEPIVNLRISFHCEPSINREYVLLLDPAPLPAIEKAVLEENINVEPINNLSDKNKKPTHQSPSKKSQPQDTNYQGATEQTSEISLDKPTLKYPAKKKKRRATNSVDEKLIESYTGKQKSEITPESSATSQNNATTTANSHPSTDKPFLVISGGSASSNENTNKPSLSLRLATEIDFTRPEAVIAPTTTTDAMDEVTVMANRLAHLEKQIASLQNRNTQLVTDAAKAKEESERFNWQQMLLIAISVIAALAVTEWSRRKIFSQRSNNESAEWFDTEASIDGTDETAVLSDSNFANNSFETKSTSEPSFNESNFSDSTSQSSSFASAGTVVTFEKEDHGSVIDDADVFIEHGRPTLAIQLLQNHLIEFPAESPAIWFKLLNLLAKESSETDYDEAVVECNKHFNIKAAKFGDASEKDNSSIEYYPHIITRLEGVWSSQYAVGFLNDLIYNKRSQPREGLEQGAFEDLFFLKLIAQHLDTSSPPTQQAGFHQPISAKPVFENASFNEALFAEVKPLDGMKTLPANNQNNIEFDSKFETTNKVDAHSNDSFTEQPNLNADALNVETMPHPSEQPYETGILLNAEATPAVDNSLEMIDFSLPQHSPLLKIDESHQAEEINFTMPTEDLKSKPKTKTKAKPSAQKQTKLNEIEWDLPGK